MNRREVVRRFAVGAALVALDACTSATQRSSSASQPASSGAPPTGAPASTASTDPTVTTGEGSLSSFPAASPPTVAEVDEPVAPTTAWSPGDPARYVNRGPADAPLVALTFHFAGAPALGTRLLDLLKADGVTSTLFAVGDWLTAHPDLGHRALDDGHELGNHTKSHQSMLKLSRAEVHSEIAGGAAALQSVTGSIGTWFRPSGTDVPNGLILEEAGKVGYAVSVGYDIDSLDYTEPGGAAVVQNVVPGLHPGAIISLHFGHADTLAALPTILDRIAALGLRTATISELLTPSPHP